MRRLVAAVIAVAGISSATADFSGSVERAGQWGIVVVLTGTVVTIVRIQVKRSEAGAVAARSDCDARITAALIAKNVELAARDAEIIRLRRLLGVAASYIHPSSPELARMFRVDAVDPGATPGYGTPVIPPPSSPPPADTP